MTATLTIELAPDVRRKLARLAEHAHRSDGTLAAEAITAYVDYESKILDGISQGFDDLNAGRLVSHDDAMNEIDAAIASAAKR